ncbi:MAG: hypothetical protein A2381_17075 [Bdellovibrionales bacterium RIFOXYB1_FULL_37_110]|nr:MAG: hypothetical protein A2181_08080 [Bdellovibrionales bacterium RIFOXYA1_FULL_38_20]OFZ50110.1 MAG: hypothetical protein A2417_18910 [Bdellovibrionales bacterium RIFOXYC1_FULL_37_79]OFZ60016.1 MAG: hypothetical protein A2381_17075 [Bdellovibrionales bacterium RIFOXYB1_FULL_37_110]OFZ64261.1 MAG: hypothetical protein A2577_12580 [Bdellovibrionales bacterium RIFOXYD1_FULL_36_51]
MKNCFIILLVMILTPITMASSLGIDPNIEESLGTLSLVGGAGNGGGSIALQIARDVNRLALRRGYNHISTDLKVLVGKYNFCSDLKPNCNITARFYSGYQILLVDHNNWVKLDDNQRANYFYDLLREQSYEI